MVAGGSQGRGKAIGAIEELIASLAAAVRMSANHAKDAQCGQRKEQPNVAANDNIYMHLHTVAAIFCSKRYS